MSALIVTSTAQPQTQHQQTFGNYTVYYNLVKTTFLSNSIAERYDIEKDDDTSILNISIRKQDKNGNTVKQPARVTGEVEDFIQVHQLDFTEFQDPSAIYYIAEISTGTRKTLNFTIQIEPQDSDADFTLAFSEFIPALE